MLRSTSQYSLFRTNYFTNFKSIYHLNGLFSNYLNNLKYENELTFKIYSTPVVTQLLFSCKGNLSAGVGSDGKSLDSTVTKSDTTTVPKKNSQEVKE